MFNDYQTWVARQGLAPGTQQCRLANLRVIARAYGDLDAAFRVDGLSRLLDRLSYSKAEEAAGIPNPTRIEIRGNVYNGLATYRAALEKYRRFKAETANCPMARRRAA